jgi:hypothetical protein
MTFLTNDSLIDSVAAVAHTQLVIVVILEVIHFRVTYYVVEALIHEAGIVNVNGRVLVDDYWLHDLVHVHSHLKYFVVKRLHLHLDVLTHTPLMFLPWLVAVLLRFDVKVA